MFSQKIIDPSQNEFSGLGTFLGALTLICFGKSSFETNLEVITEYVFCTGLYTYIFAKLSKAFLAVLGKAFSYSLHSTALLLWKKLWFMAKVFDCVWVVSSIYSVLLW